ncbi:hypothetical protein Isop_0430 [Isosphaera pallida ATCC 43644]|jgi:hypothetical protein|uniref:Uncharacterized protein n=1 Tax=Isosphaera pallida (strain ATCC 43644 / DSM 9630 / IS1B) TaxID=575540 RepID=E8QYP9_ISOPI|nr:hypothetical protein Isop_0430 [Isosphaera pallida ATCC 43644]
MVGLTGDSSLWARNLQKIPPCLNRPRPLLSASVNPVIANVNTREFIAIEYALEIVGLAPETQPVPNPDSTSRTESLK